MNLHSPYRSVTMADIASVAGVHHTTVSLALRDHHSISLETRVLIRQIAARFGYRRNPRLDAFNARRRQPAASSSLKNTAFVVHTKAARFFSGRHFHPAVFEGAKLAAQSWDHSLEVFHVGPKALSGRRLGEILDARGFRSVLISTFDIDIGDLEFDWSHLCAIKIECRHLRPTVDSVSMDHVSVTRLAIQNLRARGYQRIGLVTAREDERRLCEAFGVGLMLEQASMPPEEAVPPLYFNAEELHRLHEPLRDWVERHRVQVVISNWNELLAVFPQARLEVPRDLAFASLDVPAGRPELTGILQDHFSVGRTAMEQLAVMAEVYQNGIPPSPCLTCLQGSWHGGASVPPRPNRAA